MSDMPNVDGWFYIAGNTISGTWSVTWNELGWHGNSLLQFQPLNPGAYMVWVPRSNSMNPDGTYTFRSQLSNVGKSTYFKLQVSSS